MTEVEQLLHQYHIKPTRKRVAVLDILTRSNQRHFTAEQLYLQLQTVGFDTGLATVYRVLNDFSSAGLLRRNQLIQGKAYYELADEQPHMHLIDIHQGEILEIQNDALVTQLLSTVQQMGYAIVDVQLNIYVKPQEQPPATVKY
ncbi:Fur family transcriptional regulator [Shewanella dokdonensis]|uniref:Ferric uptake regulation protein n=1 Tax=Shewanella dokdonensis TaxID=712036 RepID=A0ABX8DKA4_9GAMM|nr:Fur family transcriptional regulator [Shewanella dokdonensis]MCL1076211.1 transcriptional repressor [Shewanella dokdonensis]QVK24411.1 transcriptional repressor [Shewanella dokdonensis]